MKNKQTDIIDTFLKEVYTEALEELELQLDKPDISLDEDRRLRQLRNKIEEAKKLCTN